MTFQFCFKLLAVMSSELSHVINKYSNLSPGYPPGLVRVEKCGERGKGLLAARRINKGEMVYQASEGVEVELSEMIIKDHLESKTDEEKKEFLMHCYCHHGKVWYVAGAGR